ncbi:MAG: hypothetical protein LAO78_14510 [Acidobacteriia bacterium]|nr:hypothetical protein [Terriglobia bacterium]
MAYLSTLHRLIFTMVKSAQQLRTPAPQKLETTPVEQLTMPEIHMIETEGKSITGFLSVCVRAA